MPRLHVQLQLMCALVVAGLAVTRCSAPANATQAERNLPDAPPDGVVRIAEASRQFLSLESAGTQTDGGTLRAPARVEFRDGALSQVSAPLQGRVVKVHVQTGDVVRAGAPLLTLDCPDAAAARAAAETATASLREARTALDRERRMLEEGVGIERERLAAETRVAEVEAEVARAQASLALAGAGSGTTVVLRSPIAGTVISRKATEGLAVQQGAEPLVEIGDPSNLWIIADVFERDLPLIHTGAVAHVELPSLHDTADGRVVSIGTVVSSGLRTVPIRIGMSAPRTLLRPGMYGRAEIALAASAGAMTLPTDAILIKGKDTVVYVEKTPTTFERRAVVIAPPINGRVHVISGLSPGEHVVVKGALLLDGAADQLL